MASSHITIPQSSDEWVERYVDSDDDPTTYTPEVALLLSGTTPGVGTTWTTAQWDYTPARQNRDGDYRSKVKFLFGVDSLDVAPGFYRVWMRLVVVNGQSPVFSLGTILVA